jgi:FkbM family methyltransferase
MNRNLPTFNESESQVKIAHFTRKGFDIKGVIHVGINDGYEMDRYVGMGIENIIGIDPLPSVWDVKKRLPSITVYQCALGSSFVTGQFFVTEDPGGSSLLFPVDCFHREIRRIFVPVLKFTDLVSMAGINLLNFDCLVLDVQGYELEVLVGMTHILSGFKFLNIECSLERNHGYEKAPNADDIIVYLKGYGFKRDTPIFEHDDIMFIREDLC